MFEEWAPGMEIHTSGACWSVGHTTVEGHSRGRGPSYQRGTCTHIYVMGWQCQLGSLKIVQSEGLQLHGTLGTHDRQSNSNSQRISLSFVMSDKTREDHD